MAVSVAYERRVSRAALWARSIANFSFVLACTAVVGHRYAMVETPAFAWVMAVVAGLAVFALVLSFIGFCQLWIRGDKAGKASLAAAIVATIVLVPFGYASYLATNYPRLHEISTDLSEPPMFLQAGGRRTGDMNPIGVISAESAMVQREAYPEIVGRRFDASMERVLDAADAVIEDMGWEVSSHAPAALPDHRELSVELVAASPGLRLPADVVIRFTDEGDTTFVDMRSNSRYGSHDLGDNARRIRGFLDDLDAEFARQSLSIIDIPASGENEDTFE